MSDRGFRLFGRFTGMILVCLGGYLMWQSLWVQAGLDAFMREWGDALSHSIDRARWSETRPDVPPPDANGVHLSLRGFMADRAANSGLVGFISCELLGSLLVLGSIRRRPKPNAANA